MYSDTLKGCRNHRFIKLAETISVGIPSRLKIGRTSRSENAHRPRLFSWHL